MKYILALGLVLLATSCFAQDSGEVSTSGLGSIFSKLFQRFQDLLKFRQLVMDEVDKGNLKIEDLREPIKNSIKDGFDCFKDQLVTFKDKIGELAKDFQEAIAGLTPTDDESGSGTQPNTVEVIGKLIKVAQSYIQKFNVPEIQDDLKALGADFKAAFKTATNCFKTSMQKAIPDDKYNMLSGLWKQSRAHNA